MGYAAKISIDNGSNIPVGSTLFGITETPASTALKLIKTETELGANFNTLLDGVTVHIQFKYGNTNTSTIQLKIGSTDAKNISNPGGNNNWPAGAVISFTFDGTNWVVNDGVVPSTSTPSTTYNPNSAEAISGQGVADALDDLDGSFTGEPDASKTFSAFSQNNGLVSGTFTPIAITKSQVTDLPILGAAAEKNVDTSITSINEEGTNLPTTAAVTSYINNKTAALTGAMHWKGTTTTDMTAAGVGRTITINSESYNANPGDVVLYSHKEYVWSGTVWELLGDEGSYALKSKTENVVKTATLTGATAPSLTINNVTVPNVTDVGTLPELQINQVSIPNVTNAGSAAEMKVENGVLKIITGSAPTIAQTNIVVKEVGSFDPGAVPTLGTAFTIGSASDWSAGSHGSINVTNQTVVVP